VLVAGSFSLPVRIAHRWGFFASAAIGPGARGCFDERTYNIESEDVRRMASLARVWCSVGVTLLPPLWVILVILVISLAGALLLLSVSPVSRVAAWHFETSLWLYFLLTTTATYRYSNKYW